MNSSKLHQSRATAFEPHAAQCPRRGSNCVWLREHSRVVPELGMFRRDKHAESRDTCTRKAANATLGEQRGENVHRLGFGTGDSESAGEDVTHPRRVTYKLRHVTSGQGRRLSVSSPAPVPFGGSPSQMKLRHTLFRLLSSLHGLRRSPPFPVVCRLLQEAPPVLSGRVVRTERPHNFYSLLEFTCNLHLLLCYKNCVYCRANCFIQFI